VSRPFPLHTGIATVTEVTPVTPAMTCFTLHAPAFADPGVEQPGEILTLGWAPDGDALVLPQRGWRFPGGIEQHWRNFTVRRHDPRSATLDVEFFLHGDAGIASAWAARAKVGDEVGFAGPRTHWLPEPHASWCLLAADETGLPALLAILESLPDDLRAIAVAEVGGPDECQPVRDGVEMHWAVRNGDGVGVGAALVETVRELELPPGPGQVWGGGESRALAKVRRHARRAAPDARLQVLGYWAAGG